MRTTARRTRLLSAAALGLAGALAAPALAQPSNNVCNRARPVIGGVYSGTTLNATSDASGDCDPAGSADVWFRYVAPFDGTLTLSTCGGATWNTLISVFDGCPAVGGMEVVCNDNACGTQSNLEIQIEGGDLYMIRVGSPSGESGPFTLTIIEEEEMGTNNGADVVYSEITDVAHYGPVGGVHAYAFGTGTCNIGDGNLHWGNSWGGTPSVGFNAYRLYDGRLMQIGQSWVKRACCAAASDGCGIGCNGVGGDMLGTGCRDTYSAGYNGSQGVLARRSSLNAFTGVHNLVGGGGNDIFGRLQIPASDLSAVNFPNAMYFAEGVYVGDDDAASGNAANNASYRRLVVSGAATLTPTGITEVGQGAIYAWRDLGLNGGPDPAVHVEPLTIPNEGHFVVAYKLADLGSGTWRYDYAILNISSDVSGGSLTIPIPPGTNVTNAGFHDVNYHSGDPYDNTDWSVTVGATSVTWASPQTHAQNPNSNALRWGTMYNFWFDADRGPAMGNATFGLFKPHTPQSVNFAAGVPSDGTIAGDLNGDGHVDLADLATLLSDFGCSAPACSGDVDLDGDTDLADLAVLLSNFGL